MASLALHHDVLDDLGLQAGEPKGSTPADHESFRSQWWFWC
jgi:hypothetical protein